MQLFKTEQKVYEVSGVKIGGQIGENPMLLIGSIFYQTKSKKILKDPKTGEIDKEVSEDLINQQIDISEKTGVPHGFDVGGGVETPDALVKVVEFVANKTNAPILPDGASAEIRIPAIKRLGEIGLSNRFIYNTIDANATAEELNAIKESKISSAILLAFHSKNIWPEQKLELITGTEEREGLLTKAKKAGIDKILIDTATLDIPSISINARTINLVKDKLGYPAGCGAHNALHTWGKSKEYEKLDKNIVQIKNVMINTLPQAMGANFVLYGPVTHCNYVFPTIAMNEAALTYNALRLNKFKNVNRTGPLFKIF
ncbi:MAG: tetrahydromethanopterin S-methyltransferase subunit H [Candidatus Lokiarchaeota archaeon]|nr:tetrahydromethanopterin S-methyltransferase subunit H [Candidatus Lokiarchaeota archaeon]